MPFLTDMYHEQNRRAGGEPVADGVKRPPGPFDPATLASKLGAKVLGQDAAVEAVVRAVTLATAGAADPYRPLANLPLVGPTGVGKTELVRQVAAELRAGPDDLCRVDMNSLAQEHYAASFTGAPPGYAGSKEAFTVFDRSTVEGDAYRPGIVLFDEVEKAHPTVLRALLHVLDNGTLRLANGTESLSFRNSFAFLTSNIGTTDLARRRGLGWRRVTDRIGRRAGEVAARLTARGNHAVVTGALRDFFDAEFLNRIDETVVFSEFDAATAERVADLQVDQLRQRLARRSVHLEVEKSVRALLAEVGFDPVYGARGLGRSVRTVLASPVAEAVVRARPAGREPLHLVAKAAGGAVVVEPRP